METQTMDYSETDVLNLLDGSPAFPPGNRRTASLILQDGEVAWGGRRALTGPGMATYTRHGRDGLVIVRYQEW